MKLLTTILTGLLPLLEGPACFAGSLADTTGTNPVKMTLQRAELLIPRTVKGPVKSLMPYDTLDTSEPSIKLVLMDDNTWKYVRDGDALKHSDYYTKNWDNYNADPYRLPYADLPDRITLWLVDSTMRFSCPYQTKVYSKFGVRRGRRHQGVDLPLAKGTPVSATFDGKVRISKYARGYGNLVVIRHENGLETFYGHLSEINVHEGDWVHAGDIVGLGGSSGRATGPHLHFETRYKGYAFDPQWIIDFENGILRHGVFTLKKKYLSEHSTYTPESEQEEEEILIAEAEDRAEAERIAAEKAAMKYHTIKSGDTLSGIAVKYGTTVNQLCQWNNLTPKSTLRIGRTIRVH